MTEILAVEFAITISKKQFASRSFNVKSVGLGAAVPAKNAVGAPRLPVPFPIKRENWWVLKLVTMTSKFPIPSISASATVCGVALQA